MVKAKPSALDRKSEVLYSHQFLEMGRAHFKDNNFINKKVTQFEYFPAYTILRINELKFTNYFLFT